MASDIKKRSASNIYYGVHKETGELLHISNVPSGLKCDCICAACGQPFGAKKGDIRRHHFAHVSNYECMYASEVAIYKAMADVLEKKRQMTLPLSNSSFLLGIPQNGFKMGRPFQLTL